MNLDIKNITAKLSAQLSPLLQKLKTYSSFIIVLIVLGLFGFVIIQIRNYATLEPSQSQVDEKLLDLKRTRIDQEAIERIENLESSNIDVKSLFDEARDNPFQE